MKNKIYYGEYTLKHWIDLLLKKNIVLPPYQRHFVWKKQKVVDLINAMENDQFVPPVTIGLFKIDGKNVNYILDGQQRLTSILLACLSLYPKMGKEGVEIVRYMNENDDENDDDLNLEEVMNWTFKELTKLGKDVDSIKINVKQELYDTLEHKPTTSFFYKKYLGFAYIVPNTNDPKEQQNYYSSVFRNINMRSVNLLVTESRKSLYFLDEGMVEFFEPDITKYKVTTPSETYILDFVRYMSLLSQYHKDGKENRVARGFKLKMEDYYEEYIYSVVGDRESLLFAQFDAIFPDRYFKARLQKLKDTMVGLEIPETYLSIIDVDTFMFGLIYNVVIQGKVINLEDKQVLKSNIQAAISLFKNDNGHKKSPASLKYLRNRIAKSIEIYSSYVNAE